MLSQNLVKKLNVASGPLAVGLSFVVAIIAGMRVTIGDAYQMLPSVERLLGFHLDGVYLDDTGATSMVVWLLLVGVPFAITRIFLPPDAAWVTAGLIASLPLLLAGVRYCVKSIYPETENYKSWGLGVLALAVPTTVACWFEFYHPQDIAAVGLVLFAFGFAAQRRWLAAGVMFGLAVLTRQWALLIALAISPLAGNFRNFLRFAVASSVVTILGLLPFMVTKNDGLWTALSASFTLSSRETIMGRILFFLNDGQMGSSLGLLVRLFPLLLTLSLAFFVWRKRWESPLFLLPLASTVIAFRLLFESVSFLYYWAPLVIFMLLINGGRKFSAIIAGMSISFGAWLVPLFVKNLNIFVSGEIILSGFYIFLALVAVLYSWVILEKANVKTKKFDMAGKRTVELKERTVFSILSWVFVFFLGAGLTAFWAPSFANWAEVKAPKSQEIMVNKEDFLSSADMRVSGDNLSQFPEFSNVGKLFPLLDGLTWEGESITIGGVGPNGRIVVVLSHWDINSQEFVKKMSERSSDDAVKGLTFEGILVEDNYQKGNWPVGLWLDSYKWAFPTIIDSEDGRGFRAVGENPSLHFFVLNAEGVVVAEHHGPLTDAMLLELVSSAD